MSSNPAQIAQAVTIRAAVTVVGGGTAGGTVDFTNTTTPIAGCTGKLVESGVAICNTSFAQAGTLIIGASYSGDASTAPSTGSMQLTVGKCAPGTYLAAAPAAPAYGAAVTLGVLVLGATGVAAPTGTVTISDGEIALATLPLGADGRASLVVPSGAIPPFSIGTHSIGAFYNGDANYGMSRAPALALVVGKVGTAIALAPTVAQIAQPVKITATLSVAGAVSGNAGGTVDFTNSANPIAGCTGMPVLAGVAVCNTSFLQIGTVAIGASYSGDANTAPSTASMQLTVVKCVPFATLLATPASPAYGAPVTLSVLVTGTAGVAVPTGSVTFSDGTVVLATVALGNDGRAALVAPSNSLAAFSIGPHTFSAVYGGDANYASATPIPLIVMVGKPATAVAVSSTTAQIAQPVKITAAVSVAGGGAAGGTVDFTNGTNPIGGCIGRPVQNGVAVCNTSFPQIGTVAIGASYTGDANTAPGTGSMQLTVGKCNAGVYLAASPAASAYGASVTLGVLVLGATGVAAPTGTVTFSDGTATLATLALGSDGRATLVAPSGTVGPLSSGTHSINAVYSGDANYLSSPAPALAVVVGRAATTVALSAAPISPKPGQSVTLTATVTPTAASGTVAFTNGANPIGGCTVVPTQNGMAICVTSFQQPGAFTIGAAYSGDANTDTSSGSLPLTVAQPAKPGPTATLAASPASPVFGAALALNLSVAATAGGPTPTGTVVFSDGTAVLATLPLNSLGQASLAAPSSTVAPLAVGAHSIGAVYNGDSYYGCATAAPANVSVVKAGTSIVLTAPYGGPFSATVTVIAPGGGTPTGQVQFSSGGASIGTAALLPQGGSFVATLPGNSQTWSLTATYLGDANFRSSTSPLVRVTAPSVQVTVTSNHNPSTFGQAVTFTINVNDPGSGTPTGSVQLLADGISLGTASLAAGTATLSTATLAVGTHIVVANYAGDATYPAASASLSQVVSKGAAASLGLSSSASATVFGQPVIFTAQLDAQAAASAPAGQVQFLDGSAALGSAPLSAGAATLTVTNLAVGSHSITASWSGDGNQGASVAAAVVQVVSKAQTTTMLSSGSGSATGSTTGPATLVATVAAVAPGAGVPTGSVKFVSVATNAVLATVVLAGAAATTPLPSGADPMLAVYSGDASFQTSSSDALTQLAATNSASYATIGVAADEIVTLFGSNLGTATAYATQQPADSLGGTTVKITDSAGVTQAAQIFYVSPAQASILVPAGLAPGSATLAVTNSSHATVSTSIAIGRVSPGLYTSNSTGQGVAAAQVIRVHADGTQSPPQTVAAFDTRQNLWVPGPIDLGVPADTAYLMLYGTGIRHYATMPGCTIGGKVVAVVYAGAQGSLPGLDQVNILLPASLRGAGTVNVVLTVDGMVANTVTLAVQ